METRETGRLYMNAASNVAGTIADHYRKSMTLSCARALRSCEYIAQLAGAKTASEVIEFSGAHYRNQLNLLGGYADNLVGLVFEMSKDVAEPFRTRAIVASCVIR